MVDKNEIDMVLACIGELEVKTLNIKHIKADFLQGVINKANDIAECYASCHDGSDGAAFDGYGGYYAQSLMKKLQGEGDD